MRSLVCRFVVSLILSCFVPAMAQEQLILHSSFISKGRISVNGFPLSLDLSVDPSSTQVRLDPYLRKGSNAIRVLPPSAPGDAQAGRCGVVVKRLVQSGQVVEGEMMIECKGLLSGELMFICKEARHDELPWLRQVRTELSREDQERIAAEYAKIASAYTRFDVETILACRRLELEHWAASTGSTYEEQLRIYRAGLKPPVDGSTRVCQSSELEVRLIPGTSLVIVAGQKAKPVIELLRGERVVGSYHVYMCLDKDEWRIIAIW